MDNNDLAGWMTQIIDLHSNLPVQTVFYGAIPRAYSFSGENEPTGVFVQIDGDPNNRVPVPTVTKGGIVGASGRQLDLVAVGDGLGPVHWIDENPRHYLPVQGTELPPLGAGETRPLYKGDLYKVYRLTAGPDPTGAFVNVDGKQFGIPSSSHGAAIDIGGKELSLYSPSGSGYIWVQELKD